MSARQRAQDVGRWFPFLSVAPLLGLIGIVIYAWSVNSGSVLAVALLVAGAAFLAGSLLGFLFGIPRSLAVEATPAGTAATPVEASPRGALYRSNTNLEQISDWLTKILVGVGLVELGRLINQTQNLVDFLAPALGNTASSPSFALALLALYSVSGFLIVYLVTRVYLGRVFARADELMRYVDERIDEVQESQRAQEEHDVNALALVNRQLEAEGAHDPISQQELQEAVAAASPLVRAQIFARAREQRQRRDPAQTERTIPVFRALAAADTDRRFHRNHAELAYALKDKANPDFQAAEAALDTAIETRDRLREGDYLLYEFNRSLCRIQTDPASATRELTNPELRDRIRADLARAMNSRYLARQIPRNETIGAWLKRNQLTVTDLTNG